MKKTDGLTKGLALIGTVLMWFPIVVTLGFGAMRTIATGRLSVDWLMPAELFPVVLVGGALLLWASLRAHSRRGLVIAGVAATAGLLVLGQLLAVVTGLASGETEPTGWEAVVVTGAIALYAAGVVVLAVAGVLLVRDLFRHGAAAEPPAIPTP